MQLKSIDCMAEFTNHRILNFSGWFELEEMSSMETLVSLEVLAAEICEGWCSVANSLN